MIILKLLIYIGKLSSRRILNQFTVLSAVYESARYNAFLKLSKEYISKRGNFWYWPELGSYLRTEKEILK